MAAPEKRQEKIEEARKLLAELSKINASARARTEDLSRDINFSEAVPYFKQMLDIIKQPINPSSERQHLTNSWDIFQIWPDC